MQDTGFTTIAFLIASSTAQQRDGSESSCYAPRVGLSSFVSLLRWGGDGWWGDGMLLGSKRFLPEAEGSVGKGTMEINVLDSPILSPESAQLCIFPTLGGVLGLQCSLFANTCTKSQEDGNRRLRDLPLASPYSTFFGKQIRSPSSGAQETIQPGSRPLAAATIQCGEQLEALVRAHRTARNSSR